RKDGISRGRKDGISCGRKDGISLGKKGRGFFCRPFFIPALLDGLRAIGGFVLFAAVPRYTHPTGAA
ncbi:hypothetical protein, partial [Achromobacter spanius]|uniref:hypothetical protein n=1 Tax=Achromobacter spanius TaxID=217203 RepID=UPI003F693516